MNHRYESPLRTSRGRKVAALGIAMAAMSACGVDAKKADNTPRQPVHTAEGTYAPTRTHSQESPRQFFCIAEDWGDVRAKHDGTIEQVAADSLASIMSKDTNSEVSVVDPMVDDCLAALEDGLAEHNNNQTVHQGDRVAVPSNITVYRQ